MVLHQRKGFARSDAKELIRMYTDNPKHHTAFIDHMMAVELRMIVPSGSEKPGTDGSVTGLSYLLFGSAPLWPAIVYAFIGGSMRAWMDTVWGAMLLQAQAVLGDQVAVHLAPGVGAVAALSAVVSLVVMFLLGAF